MSKNAVSYCVSGSHIQLTTISIASICKNYLSEEPLDILIVTKDVISQDINRIRNIPDLYKKSQIKIFIWAPPLIVDEIKGYSNERFPLVTLWRLFLPSYFSKYEKIMYLDNDTIVYNDISDFFDLITPTYVVAAVRDFYAYMYNHFEELGKSYGIETMKNYFNSGFIIFNVSHFNEIATPDLLLNMINEQKYDCLDQTILNIICSGKVLYLDFSYNYQKDDHWLYDWAVHFNLDAAKEIEKQRSSIKIRHFCEFERNSMPWEHFTVLDEFERDFWEYLYAIKRMDYERNQ